MVWRGVCAENQWYSKVKAICQPMDNKQVFPPKAMALELQCPGIAVVWGEGFEPSVLEGTFGHHDWASHSLSTGAVQDGWKSCALSGPAVMLQLGICLN